MWKLSRRAFIPALGAAMISAGLPLNIKLGEDDENLNEEKKDPLTIIKPRALKRGDLLAVTSPAGPLRDVKEADKFKLLLEGLGFRVVMGKTVKTKTGFLAGPDDMRLQELHQFFLDPEVKGIVCMKGGWGCGRILDKIDYDLIRSHPKILIGFSDITSLINAIWLYSGVIAYHGPVGNSSWNDYSVDYLMRVLVKGEKVKYLPGPDKEDTITIHSPGTATGILTGGNLSVMSDLMGTPFFPDLKGKILFLEDVAEEPFRIDRMLTQFRLAGAWRELSGVIIGKCRKCVAEEPDFAFTVDEIYKEHFSGLKIPVYSGAMIGHIVNKYTVPIGIPVTMDANAGSFQLLESAVEVI
jgi:muramoyltetrapeptide carboxypeptidase